MNRFHQGMLIASFLPLCWFAMLGVHELGHIFSAWLTGGKVTQVVLHPLSISRTDVKPNPSPLVVVWAGPLFGVLFPILLWSILSALQVTRSYLFRFFAGFCLIANGLYIAVGSFEGVGDAGVMLQQGSQIESLWLFGLFTVPAGFLLWHGLGPQFGLGKTKKEVDSRTAYVSLLLLIIVIICSASFSSRF